MWEYLILMSITVTKCLVLQAWPLLCSVHCWIHFETFDFHWLSVWHSTARERDQSHCSLFWISSTQKLYNQLNILYFTVYVLLMSCLWCQLVLENLHQPLTSYVKEIFGFWWFKFPYLKKTQSVEDNKKYIFIDRSKICSDFSARSILCWKRCLNYGTWHHSVSFSHPNNSLNLWIITSHWHMVSELSQPDTWPWCAFCGVRPRIPS